MKDYILAKNVNRYQNPSQERLFWENISILTCFAAFVNPSIAERNKLAPRNRLKSQKPEEEQRLPRACSEKAD
jgi:hypothetical protein